MGECFFTRVMSIPVAPITRVNPNALDKRPTPETPAKRHSKKAVDIFKIYLEPDAGGDPHSHDSFYEEHLANLSEPELEALKKRVLLLRDRCLQGSDEHATMTRAHSFIESAVDKRLGLSEQYTAKLREMIRSKLSSLEPIDIKKSAKGELVVIIAETATMSLEEFVRTHFGEIIAEFEKLLARKKIVPKTSGTGGLSFVIEALRKLVRRDKG